ncbi:MAG: MerR family transcriptional regulator [Candidatus Omnitrophota bacterium]
MTTKSDNTKTSAKFVSLQEISKVFSLSYQTLNYYTSLGLLRSTKRQGNKRLYLISEARDRLERITKFKNEGYPLRVICGILNRDQDVTDELL